MIIHPHRTPLKFCMLLLNMLVSCLTHIDFPVFSPYLQDFFIINNFSLVIYFLSLKNHILYIGKYDDILSTFSTFYNFYPHIKLNPDSYALKLTYNLYKYIKIHLNLSKKRYFYYLLTIV